MNQQQERSTTQSEQSGWTDALLGSCVIIIEWSRGRPSATQTHTPAIDQPARIEIRSKSLHNGATLQTCNRKSEIQGFRQAVTRT